MAEEHWSDTPRGYERRVRCVAERIRQLIFKRDADEFVLQDGDVRLLIRLDNGWVHAFDLNHPTKEEIFNAFMGREWNWKAERNFSWNSTKVDALLVPALDRALVLEDLSQL